MAPSICHSTNLLSDVLHIYVEIRRLLYGLGGSRGY